MAAAGGIGVTIAFSNPRRRLTHTSNNGNS